MPTLVQFGAGNIGRGFIAPVFCAAGWRVVFVDIDRLRIGALAERRRYTVFEVSNAGRKAVAVGPVEGLLAGDGPAVAALLAGADLVATAVGLGALKHLGPNLAAGLERRWQANGGPLDILVCENGVQAPELLRAAILAHLPVGLQPQLAQQVGFVRTSIGRMIPPPPAEADLLDLAVEPYAKLPLEAQAFRGRPPQVPGVILAPDFDLVLRQKLYIHNLTHACLAYAGRRRGHATIPDCMADDGLVQAMRQAGADASEALARAHGGDEAGRQAIRAECAHILDDLCERYRNRALADDVVRVGRDLARKLAGDDRLIGAARLCFAQGVVPTTLCHFILEACAWPVADDEPQAAHLRALQAQGPMALLRDLAGLTDQEPLMKATTKAQRQQQAAALIRQAGLVLTDTEAAHIEIADFGLGRYEEIGLAIHVYVNTDRCCAKELILLPWQICPEHLHPAIGDYPGKEETFRCRTGEVYLYLPGPATAQPSARVPAARRAWMTVWNEVILRPGQQATLGPQTRHWFQAGPQGAIVSEFSTRSYDQADLFTDPAIIRRSNLD